MLHTNIVSLNVFIVHLICWILHSCFQVLSVSPEHPGVLLLLRQVQCQHLLSAAADTVLPDVVLEQLNNTVMINPTNLSAWHVSGSCKLLLKSFYFKLLLIEHLKGCFEILNI